MTAQHAIPGRWAEHAACAGQQDLMSIPVGTKKYVTKQTIKAKKLCMTCPVRIQCATWAMTNPDPAYLLVAGGMTYRERQQKRACSRRAEEETA